VRLLQIGLAVLSAAFVTVQAMAATTVGNHYTVTLDTGLREFIAGFPNQTINTDGSIAGSTVSDTSPRMTVPAFDTRYGSVIGLGGLTAFLGYPFEATFSVEGATDNIGDKVIAQEDVTGTVQMFVNGSSVGSVPFGVSLNPVCTAQTNGFTIDLCSDEQKQASFTGGAPVLIHAGDTVTFQYTLSETNVSCEVLPVGGGAPQICIEGNTGITDLHNINDPQWDGSLAVTYDYIPEPASLTILGLGVAGLIGVRRRRLTGRAA
jgi:PEP-CTERM motif